ncbi:MAG: hypothetical protein K0S08_669 [Gammaproteobacteria bacterium]|nr:hypothetical protein [Gammaproteobacteria bacterium]
MITMFKPRLSAAFVAVLCLNYSISAMAELVPQGAGDNSLYYKIGGGSNYILPPVQSSNSIILNTDADLGAGYSCGAFNPMSSIKNVFNNFKNSADNIEQSTITNMQASIAEIPAYMLAQADQNLYNMINNTLLGAHNQIDVSTKSCQVVKQEIAAGKNPYKDWGTIAVDNQWKKHLSLTSQGEEDINDAKKDIDQHSGDDGVPWAQGIKTSDGTFAGGKGQPVIHVVADTTKAGYNALLNRDITSDAPAPKNSENIALVNAFPTPQSAQAWVTNVVGDQNVTTCTTDSSCQSAQGGVAGRGLLPLLSTCDAGNQNFCAENIRQNLAKLVTNQSSMTNENLAAVSADGVMISPQVIRSIQSMDTTQQGIIVNKLAQEVATQKVIDTALLARNILQTGAQVPVVASNKPAQVIVEQSIHALDNDIQSLSFESQIKKQMTSDTLSNILAYQQNMQQAAVSIPKTTVAQSFINNGAASK